MSTIANSTIKLSLDSTSVQRGVDAISKKFAGMGTAIKVGMAAAATASLAYFKGFVDRMGEVADMATRLGITTDEVQRIGLVAKQSGTDVDQVAKAMERFSVNLVKAGEGGEAAAKGLERLGITSAGFLSLSMDEKLLKLSEAYSQSNQGAEELAGLMALLGKSGAELIPLLSMGPEKMAEALAKANPVAGQTVQQMEALGDQMDALKQQFEYVFAVVITKAAAYFNAFVAATTADIMALVELVKGLGIAATGDVSGAGKKFALAGEIRKQGYEGAAEYLKPPPTKTDSMRQELKDLTDRYEQVKRDPMNGKESGELFMAIKKLTAAIERQNSPAFPQ